jgi:hypothetical protein
MLVFPTVKTKVALRAVGSVAGDRETKRVTDTMVGEMWRLASLSPLMLFGS